MDLFGIPHTVGQAFRRLRLLIANRNLLRKLCRLDFKMLRGCHRIQRGFLEAMPLLLPKICTSEAIPPLHSSTLVWHRLAHNACCDELGIPFWSCQSVHLQCQVLDKRLSPITARCGNYQDQLLDRGRFMNCLLLLNGWSLKILDKDTSWDLSSGRP